MPSPKKRVRKPRKKIAKRPVAKKKATKKKAKAKKKAIAKPSVGAAPMIAMATAEALPIPTAPMPMMAMATATFVPMPIAPAPAAPAPTPPPLGVELLSNFAWSNYGGNLSTQVGTLYRLSNGPANEPNVGLKAIQWAVRDLAAQGKNASASGSRWSFSEVALNPGAMIDVRAMADQLTFEAEDLANPAEVSSLIQVQGGTTIHQIIQYAEEAGQDLKAMGGNCGQTIAGAIATGTHGGFLQHPGFPDMVRALYLVGEDGKRYWLERATRPVLSTALAATYSAANVTVKRDDAFFNHAVVSLGAFGLVYAVVLETTAAYSVQLSRKMVDFDDAIDAATFDRDFSSFGPVPPIDFATVVNPYRMALKDGKWRGQGAAVRTVLNLAAPTPAPPTGGVSTSLNDGDLGPLLAGFAGAVPGAVVPLMNALMSALYGDREAAGPMSIAYPLSLTHAPTLGMELGVPGNRARELFGIILGYIQGASLALPGAVAIRQTLKSDATLSLAKWDKTTTFEFACLAVSQTEQLLTGLLDLLEKQTIPFTIHLGMLHGRSAAATAWLTRDRFQRMYGAAALAAWVEARKTTCATGKILTNPLTRSLGLTS